LHTIFGQANAEQALAEMHNIGLTIWRPAFFVEEFVQGLTCGYSGDADPHSGDTDPPERNGSFV
jgi:hypothetical protein